MKTVSVLVGLALTLALILNASSLSCTVDSDCDSLDGARDSADYCEYYPTNGVYYDVTNYSCNAFSQCVKGTSVPKLATNCSALPGRGIRTSPDYCYSPHVSAFNVTGFGCDYDLAQCVPRTEMNISVCPSTTSYSYSCSSNVWTRTTTYSGQCNYSSGYCIGTSYLENWTWNCSYGRLSLTKACVGNKLLTNISSQRCVANSNACVNNVTSPHTLVDCEAFTNYTCMNGDRYRLTNTCGNKDCSVGSYTKIDPAYPDCSYTAACQGSAEDLTLWYKPMHPYYEINLDKEYAMDGGGVYLVLPNSTMDILNIYTASDECGNVYESISNPNLVVWVYNGSEAGEKLKTTQNNMAISNSLNRSDVIGDNSSTYGTPVLNPFTSMLFVRSSTYYTFGGVTYTDYFKIVSSANITGVYNFTGHHNYTLYIDEIAGICGTHFTYNNTLDNGKISPNYICPWLGGSGRSDLCYDSDGNPVEGWKPIDELNIRVIDLNLSIESPPGEPDTKPGTILKTWVLNNTGTGELNVNVSFDCGGWACHFEDGYIAGRQFQLAEGVLQPMTLNITTNPADQIHNVGIIVTYDDAYGFSAIPEREEKSYITFGTSIVT